MSEVIRLTDLPYTEVMVRWFSDDLKNKTSITKVGNKIQAMHFIFCLERLSVKVYSFLMCGSPGIAFYNLHRLLNTLPSLLAQACNIADEKEIQTECWLEKPTSLHSSPFRKVEEVTVFSLSLQKEGGVGWGWVGG